MKRYLLCGPLLLALLFGSLVSLRFDTACAQDQPAKEATLEKAEPSETAPQIEKPPVLKQKRKLRAMRGGVGRHNGREIVEFGRDVVIEKGETKQNVVVIGGDVKVDGDVDRDVVVIGGSAEVNGAVNGCLVVVLGSLKMGPDAQVQRDAVVIGGPFEQDDTATIGGERVFVGLNHALPNFGWLKQWLSRGLMLARPLPPGLMWVWGVAVVFLMIYLLLALLFPRPLQASVISLQERPIGSFFTGVLVLLLFVPLVIFLAITIVGIPVIFFLICATVFAFLFGKAAVYSYAGQQVTRQWKPDGAKLMLVLLIGAVLFYLIYMVPVVGFLTWGMVTVLGLGAVVLAAFRSFRREDAPAYPSAPPVIVTGVGAATIAGTAGGAENLPPTEVVVMQRVGFWRRSVATFLDFILLCLLIPVTGPAFLLIWAAYHVAMWTWKGTTIGGIVMGIKVVRLNGAAVNFSVALVRCLSSFFSALVLFIGFFWAGWDRDKQSWHDKIAGTIVVRVPKGMSLI